MWQESRGELPDFQAEIERRFRGAENLQRFSENLQRFSENLQRFLPNIGDKFEINQPLFPHAPCWCVNNRQQPPIEVCK